MKYIIIITVVASLFAISGTVLAANVGKNVLVAEKIWGYVKPINNETRVYRLVDSEFNNVCYFAYGVQNSLPQVSCVHGD